MMSAFYTHVHYPNKTPVMAWQNTDDSPMPDWVAERTTRMSGGRLLYEDRFGVEIFELGEWITISSDGLLDALPPGIFELNYRRM